MDEVAAAFADIVGFTALGEELPPAELSGIAERLEALAARARAHAGVGGQDDRRRRDDRLARPRAARGRRARADRGRAATGPAAAARRHRLRPRRRPARRLVRPGGQPRRAAHRPARGPTRSWSPTRCATRSATPDAYAFSEAGHKRFKGITDPVPVLRLRPRRATPERGRRSRRVAAVAVEHVGRTEALAAGAAQAGEDAVGALEVGGDADGEARDARARGAAAADRAAGDAPAALEPVDGDRCRRARRPSSARCAASRPRSACARCARRTTDSDGWA